MKQLVLCVVTLNFLLLIKSAYSADQPQESPVVISPEYEDSEHHIVQYEVRRSLTLQCNITWNPNVGSAETFTVLWKKDNTTLNKNDKYSMTQNGHTYKLIIEKTDENDMGTYTCGAYQDKIPLAEKPIRVTIKMLVNVPNFHNVVEGDKLILRCNVKGNPLPILHWTILLNDTFNITLTESSGRYSLIEDKEHQLKNAVLEVEDIQMEDGGEYTCIGTSPIGNFVESKTCIVKIKDKYAAVWPFLGICAEVIVLCVVIFVYEKKRNKTELEESDTDQSPDQKNTPEHGKDSNLRHRQQ